jgi:hypothetical protein
MDFYFWEDGACDLRRKVRTENDEQNQIRSESGADRTNGDVKAYHRPINQYKAVMTDPWTGNQKWHYSLGANAVNFPCFTDNFFLFLFLHHIYYIYIYFFFLCVILD